MVFGPGVSATQAQPMRAIKQKVKSKAVLIAFQHTRFAWLAASAFPDPPLPPADNKQREQPVAKLFKISGSPTSQPVTRRESSQYRRRKHLPIRRDDLR